MITKAFTRGHGFFKNLVYMNGTILYNKTLSSVSKVGRLIISILQSASQQSNENLTKVWKTEIGPLQDDRAWSRGH